MTIQELLEQYAQGTAQLADCIRGMSEEHLNARPIEGKWSTREVVCHIVDFEPIYADRMKRVLIEDKPALQGGDPDVFAAGLSYDKRDLENELILMDSVRKQMLTIFADCDEAAFQRTGMHSRDGELSLQTLLQRITGHVPHHIKTIRDKQEALGI